MQNIVKLNRIMLHIGKYISGLAILSMMMFIVTDVFLRNIFGISIPGAYIIVETYLMPLAIFPALGYVYMVGMLPRLNEFIDKRPSWFRKINDVLIHTIDILVFTLLVYFSYSYAISGFHENISLSIASKLIPAWPIFFIVPIGYFLVLSELLIKVIQRKRFYQ